MSDERRWRWGRWLGGLAAFAILLTTLAYVARGRAAVSDLTAVIAELDAADPGWRMDDILRVPQEARPNSVPRIVTLAGALPSGWPDDKARGTLKKVPPNALLDGRQRALLDGLLGGLPREAARGLVNHPEGRFEVRVREFVPETRDLRQAWTVARLLWLDALDLAQAGKAEDALVSARACLNVGRALDSDPTMLSQLYRMGMGALAFDAAERAMALGEPSDAALAEMARAVGVGPGPGAWTQAIRTERAIKHAVFTEIGAGRLDPIDAVERLDVPKASLFALGGPLVRQEMVRREHAAVLRLMTRMVEATRLPPAEQFAAETAINAERKAAPGLVTPVLFYYFAQRNADARTGGCLPPAIRGLIAVERYRIRHGRWPATLADVVPDFLDKVPEDPIDGAPLRYKRTADGVVVYSIGNDRKDDGGDIEGLKNDIGYRLWDVDKRRARP